MKHFTEIFGQTNPKKARLLVDDQVMSSLKLTYTVEESGIKNGQLIYVEFLLPNNTWPTDNLKEKEKNKNKEDLNKIERNGKTFTVGLFNMGNTCYMNSAM